MLSRLWLTVFLLSFAILRSAAAQTDQQREQARVLATDGFEALQRRDFAVAEDRFRRADALVHAPTLVVDHARALTGLGRLVEAHERYELVRREGIPSNAPWQWRRAYQDAQTELAALEPRLAWLTIQVQGPSEPNVRVDSKPVPLAALGVRRATDPGTHSVSVNAAGFLPKEEMVTLDEGQSQSLTIELEPVPAAPEPSVVAPPTPKPTGPAPERRSKGNNTFAYVALGFSGLAIAGGIVTGALALSARSDLSSWCPQGVCLPRTRAELRRDENARSRYRRYGTISGVSFALGAAAAGTGVTLLLLSGNSTQKTAAALPFTASISRNAVDLSFESAF